MASLLQCQKLDVRAGKRRLIDSLDLAIENDQCWAILGKNGAGKTCLLHQLSGLFNDPANNIDLLGQPISQYPPRRRAQLIGLVAQHSHTGFQQTALDLALSGHYPRQINHFWDSTQAIHTAQQALGDLGVGELAEQPLQQLSGGELRRVEIARLLVQKPRLAMLDEPLNHLDISQQIHILQLLKQRFMGEKALILVLHDLNLARQIATHCILLFGDGRWLAGPTGQIATRDRLSALMEYPLFEYATPHGPLIAPQSGAFTDPANG